MISCNWRYEMLIVDRHYEYLASLAPLQRMTERFRLELCEMPIHIGADEPFAGWFGPDWEIDFHGLRKLGQPMTEEEKRVLDFPQSVGSSVSFDKSHTCALYERILREGLGAYEGRILAALREDADNEYLLAMRDSLRAARDFCERVAEKAEEAGRSDIAGMMRKVPFSPAETLTEALQSVWMIHFFIPLSENGWYSISLGRFDQYMLPYYEKALADGMSRAEIKRLLRHFWDLLNGYADAACLLNVGAQYNELSILLIECQKEFSLPSPILGARIAQDTPGHILESLIDERLFARGQPTFYGEESCVRALVQRGIPAEEARCFANNSCMGISLAGREINNMWGCVYNVSAALEMAVTGGRLLREDGAAAREFASMDALLQAFEAQCARLMDGCLAAYDLTAARVERYEPNPFLTLITEGAIEKKCDRVSSAEFRNATVECMGMVNVSDGLYAIDQLVFKEKRCTLSELTQAVRANFVGHEALRDEVARLSKYGQNGAADEYAVRVAGMLARLIAAHDHDNVHFLPSLHTLDTNVHRGAQWGAGFDGRLAGTPFAKNAGPCNEARSSGLTSVVLSAARLPQAEFYGGQPIDLLFTPAMVRDQKDRVAALIRVYLENGGLQLQVNAVSSDILRDALAHPEAHQDLVVRIGGYSDYFRKFSHQTKLEFIERFEREEQA